MSRNGQLTLESMSQAVWYNQWTLKKFRQYLKGKILEVGCGIGNFTLTLVNYGQVYAIDINKDYLQQISKTLGDKGKSGYGDIEKGKYFFNQLQFDSIVCLNVLEHINNDTKALGNIHNLLKNEGYLILLVPLHQLLYGEIDQAIGHFRRYAKSEIISKIKNAGFNIIASKKLNFLGAIGWYIAGKILKEKKVKDKRVKVFNFLAPFSLAIEDFTEPPFGTSLLIIAKKDK